MKKVKRTVELPRLDVGEAQRAFERNLSVLEAIPRNELQSARIDLQVAAAAAYSVAIRDFQPARRERLEAVALENVFNIATLDALPGIALCAWHVRRKQNEAVEASSAARVPAATVRAAQDTRGRMLRVLAHYYDDHAEYGPRVTAIRSGAGHFDLANDLLALADFYEEAEVKALIARDPLHYREDDPATARQHAQKLFEKLGIAEDSEASRWSDLAQRAWTLLVREYGALRAAGQLVFRNDEDVDVSYPSLVSAARTSRASAPVTEPPTEEPSEPEGAPTEDPEPVATT